jgi:hypothetical protein
LKENLLKKRSATPKKWIIAIFAVAIIGIAGTVGGTYFLNIASVGPSLLSPLTQTTSSSTFTVLLTSQPLATQQPTSEPSHTPAVLTANLDDAINESFVQANFSGISLTKLNVTLKSTVNDSLEVTILPGTVFESQSADVQDRVVVERRLVYLEFLGSTSSLNVSAACTNMSLSQPDENSTFVLSQDPVPSDLIKLLNLTEFENATLRVKQFAIWTITENPARDEYTGLTNATAVSGTGPSDDELQQIKTLFERADILTSKYQALQ